MPSPMELLEQIAERDKALGQSLRALLEAVGEMHAEDKGEIEKWRKSAQVYRDRYILALNDRDVAQAELEIKNEDAEIGRLVRKMPDGTALQRTGRHYYAMRCHPKVGYRSIAASCAINPAEALRSIQEEGNAGT